VGANARTPVNKHLTIILYILYLFISKTQFLETFSNQVVELPILETSPSAAVGAAIGAATLWVVWFESIADNPVGPYLVKTSVKSFRIYIL
jgi:hypothetical protein